MWDLRSAYIMIKAVPSVKPINPGVDQFSRSEILKPTKFELRRAKSSANWKLDFQKAFLPYNGPHFKIELYFFTWGADHGVLMEDFLVNFSNETLRKKLLFFSFLCFTFVFSSFTYFVLFTNFVLSVFVLMYFFPTKSGSKRSFSPIFSYGLNIFRYSDLARIFYSHPFELGSFRTCSMSLFFKTISSENLQVQISE
jgi:hypothetical protein